MFEYTIAIVDSDDFHINMLRRNLTVYMKKYGILFELKIYKDADEFLEALSASTLSLAIISIDCPEGTVSKQLYDMKLSTPIIFASADSQHAYDACKNAASGFLLKPVLFSDLEELLNQLLPVLYLQMQVPNNSNSLLIKRDGQPFYVLTKDIMYLEKYRNLLNIYTTTFCYHSYHTIKQVKQELNPKQFIQIHQGCLVNWNYVRAIRDHLIIMDHCQLYISNSQYKSVLFHAQMHPLEQRITSHYPSAASASKISDTPSGYHLCDSSHKPSEWSYCESTTANASPAHKESLRHTALPAPLQNTMPPSY